MSEPWKPGDKAVVDDPGRPRHRLVVWLVAEFRKDGFAAWGVAETPGGRIVDAFEGRSLRRPEDLNRRDWRERAVEALCVAVVIATFAWLFLPRAK